MLQLRLCSMTTTWVVCCLPIPSSSSAVMQRFRLHSIFCVDCSRVFIEYKRLLADYFADILSHKSSLRWESYFLLFDYFSFFTVLLQRKSNKTGSICTLPIQRIALFASLEWKNRFNFVRWFITSRNFHIFFHVIVDKPSPSISHTPLVSTMAKVNSKPKLIFFSFTFACKCANQFFYGLSFSFPLALFISILRLLQQQHPSAAHIPFKLLCTLAALCGQNNVFIKRIAPPLYGGKGVGGDGSDERLDEQKEKWIM